MFLRNSIVREMTFRGNFIIELCTELFWFVAQYLLFDIIYGNVGNIAGWSRSEYFGFMATGMLTNALVEALFMPNCAEFGELIRTGNLDFALLKPIDTQFLVSFRTVSLVNFGQVGLALSLLGYSLSRSGTVVTLQSVFMYLVLVATGVTFFYSLMISLAATSVWFGRNQGLYDFWFYVTVFARYPQNVYRRTGAGNLIWFGFSFIIPILLVITVPARVILQKSLDPGSWIIVFAPAFSLATLYFSRLLFQWSLNQYRSASS